MADRISTRSREARNNGLSSVETPLNGAKGASGLVGGTVGGGGAPGVGYSEVHGECYGWTDGHVGENYVALDRFARG